MTRASLATTALAARALAATAALMTTPIWARAQTGGSQPPTSASAKVPAKVAPTVSPTVAPKVAAKIDTAAIVRRLMLGARFATLVTLDETGAPRSRTVQPKSPEPDFSVWIATNPRTRKVTDIARDGRVVMHYFDPVRMGYVSIAGKARVVRERAEQAAHWDKSWDSFYPDRENGVVLIGVVPDRIEIVSDKDGITGDKASWLPPRWSPLGSRKR